MNEAETNEQSLLKNELEGVTTAIAVLAQRKKVIEARLGEIDSFNLRRDESLKSGAKWFKQRGTKGMAEFFFERDLAIVDLQTGNEPSDGKCKNPFKQIWKDRELFLPLMEFFKQGSKQRAESLFQTGYGDKIKRGKLVQLLENLKKGGMIDFEEDTAVQGFRIRARNISFLNGGWAESLAVQLVRNTVQKFCGEHPDLKPHFIRNVKLQDLRRASTCEHSDMEIDIVLEIGGRMYLFETKSGHRFGLDRTIERMRRLGDLESYRYFTLTLEEHVDPRRFEPFRIMPFMKIEECLTKTLCRDFGVLRQ